METLKSVLTGVLCACSLASCFCWSKSALAKVPEKKPGSIIIWTDEKGFRMDVTATAKKQSKWNGIAAAFASVAAVSQAISVLLP